MQYLDVLKTRKVLIALPVIILSIFGLWFGFLQPKTEVVDFPQASFVSQLEDKEEVPEETIVPPEPASIKVDIKGAVRSEGVYTMTADQRVIDLVEAAGGFLPEADKRSVNLAQKLTDEAVIYVAREGEEISLPQATSFSSGSSATGKINLNRASLTELQTITGIGAKRAQDIIDYRESIGGFKALEDLKNVSGIGDKTFDKIVGDLTLD